MGLLIGEPRFAILSDKYDRFLDRVYAVRDAEIDFARQLVAFLQHRAASPFHQISPHFSDENKRGVMKLAHLEELPHEEHFEKHSNPAGNDDERVGNNHEIVEP